MDTNRTIKGPDIDFGEFLRFIGMAVDDSKPWHNISSVGQILTSAYKRVCPCNLGTQLCKEQNPMHVLEEVTGINVAG